MQVKTGAYTGDGNATQAITGVGFQPDFVLSYNDVNKRNAYRTSNMAGTNGICLTDGGFNPWNDWIRT